MEKIKTNTDNKNNALEDQESQISEKKAIFVLSKIKKIKNWTQDEDDILMKVAEKFEFKNWNAIADNLPGRSAIQCSARYKRIKPGIVKGAWTEEEDEYLLDLLKRFGKNWSLISKYMPTRSGKQIRDRFLNALDPNILKEKFSSEEDKQILSLYSKFGTAWSKIAKFLPRRTGDMIKNRFYSSLRKQIHSDDYREGLKKKKLSSNINSDLEDKDEQACSTTKKIGNSTVKRKKKLQKRRVIMSKSGSKYIQESNKMNENFNRSNNNNIIMSNFIIPNENIFDSSNIKNLHHNQNELNNIKDNLYSNQSNMLYNMNNILYNNYDNVLPFNNFNNCNTSNNYLNNINNLSNILQQSILGNLMLLKQEQNLLNFNILDFKMTQLINGLLENNYYSGVGSTRVELENQLSILKQLEDYTSMKLKCFKRNENPQGSLSHFNSDINNNADIRLDTITATTNSNINLLKNENPDFNRIKTEKSPDRD